MAAHRLPVAPPPDGDVVDGRGVGSRWGGDGTTVGEGRSGGRGIMVDEGSGRCGGGNGGGGGGGSGVETAFEIETENSLGVVH